MKLLYKTYLKAVLILLAVSFSGMAIALVRIAFVSYIGFIVAISGPLVLGVYLLRKWDNIRAQLTEKEKNGLTVKAYLLGSFCGIFFSVLSFFVLLSNIGEFF